MIATTPRSGSWLLSETLNATGLVGEPQEYFNVGVYADWCKAFGLPRKGPYLRFVEEVVAHSTGDNGVFSVKFHWTQLRAFRRRIHMIPGEWPEDDGELLDHFFPNLRFVHLLRQDTARQAISYWRANKSSQWWQLDSDPDDAVEEPEPDFAQIRWMEDMMIDQEEHWQAVFARHQAPRLDIAYEDFVEDRVATVRQILDLLEIDPPAIINLPEPHLQKQADDQTEEWLVAYNAIRDSLPPLPKPYGWSPELRMIVPADQATGARTRSGRARAARPHRPIPAPAEDPPRPIRDRTDLPDLPDLLPWSFRYVVDEEGGDTGFGVLRSPIGDEEMDLFERFKQGRQLLGWSSYGTFPRAHRFFDGVGPATTGLHGKERPYLADCRGWLHCFRYPNRFLPRDVPRTLISESDFTDPLVVRSHGLPDGPVDKQWDVIYVCCPNDFNERTKNWSLAKRCLTRLHDELGTTALLVGRAGAPDVPDVPGIETTDELPWHELMAALARSRSILIPNILDASPVLLTEALCLDVPVAVNHKILGGWKYVAPETGRFFTDENDVVAAIAACMSEEFAPAAWYSGFYGPEHTGARLAEFLRLVARSFPGESKPPSHRWWTAELSDCLV